MLLMEPSPELENQVLKEKKVPTQNQIRLYEMVPVLGLV